MVIVNVKGQESLAGGEGGSQGLTAKALGLLFCQQALCLSGGTSDPCSSKQPTGQRFPAPPCSHGFFGGPICRGSSPAVVELWSSSCWNTVLSAGLWQSRRWENHPLFQAAPLEILRLVARLSIIAILRVIYYFCEQPVGRLMNRARLSRSVSARWGGSGIFRNSKT